MKSDPTLPNLQAQTEAGAAIALPWSREEKPLLTGFDSSKMEDPSDGPWIATASPFSAQSIVTATVVPDASGGIGVYREGFSTRSQSSQEHLSASLGITVGYPFLNANVTGEYDSNVKETKNVSVCKHTSLLIPQFLLCAIPRDWFQAGLTRDKLGARPSNLHGTPRSA